MRLAAPHAEEGCHCQTAEDAARGIVQSRSFLFLHQILASEKFKKNSLYVKV